MKREVSIEEQIAELTPEQQNKVLKAGKFAIIGCALVGIPWILGCILGLFVLIDPPLGFDHSNYNGLCIGYFMWAIIGFLLYMMVPIITKLVWPYYSDAKFRYIKKQRKANKG